MQYMAGDMTREERIERFIDGLDELAVETQIVLVADDQDSTLIHVVPVEEYQDGELCASIH